MIEEISKFLMTNGCNNKPIVLEQLKTGCIVAISHRVDNHGYLRLRRSGKAVLAHRIIYRHFHGSISDGMLVCHTCDRPACVNPLHLFAGSQKDNMRDCTKKGRNGAIGNTWTRGQTWSRGEKHGRAKLTNEKVIEIRRKYATGKYSQSGLGREFGVHHTQIGYIVTRKQWKHL